MDYFTFEPNSTRDGYILTGTQKILPADVVTPSEYMGLPVTTIGEGAFEGCTEIKSVVVHDEVSRIGGSAFADCTSLKKVALPPQLTTIYEKTFSGCVALEAIDLPQALQYIRAAAFENCTSLLELSLPANIKYIYSFGAFDLDPSNIAVTKEDMLSADPNYTSIVSGCTRLQRIRIYSGTKVGKGAFSWCSLSERGIIIID